MRDFSKVSPVLWRSKRFRNLPSDQARLTYLYLLTNKHQTSAGAYELPPAYAADDLGWCVSTVKTALKELETAGLIHVDEQTNELMITRWFKHNGPTNPSHRKGVVKCISQIESEMLKEALQNELEKVSPETTAQVHRHPSLADVNQRLRGSSM
jgi:Fe2+ or Zn2+ uptake regulation protein